MGRTLPIPAGNLQAAATAFNASIERFKTRITGDQFTDFYRRLALGLLQKIVMATPVDTGRARGNWQVTITTPPRREVDGWQGRDPIVAGTNTISQLRSLRVVYIANHVPYIVYLERGSSRRAPQGMVAAALANFTVAFNRGEIGR